MSFSTFKEQYLEAESNRYISRRSHPEHEGLFVLRYTERCIFNQAWSSTTLACRDIVVDEKNERIVTKGFTKFFNHRQHPAFEEELATGHFKEDVIEMTEKMDGVMVLSYVYDGKLDFASEGSFTSHPAKLAKKIWDEKYRREDRGVPGELTMIFDVIHPSIKVIVPYDFEDIVLVGIVNNVTGEDYTYEKLKEFAEEWNLRIPLMHKLSIEEAIKRASVLAYDKEGYVVRYGNDMRVKIKGKEYLKVFQLVRLMSEKQKVKAWVRGEFQGIIDELPEEFAEDFRQTERIFERKKMAMLNEVEKNFSVAPKESRKDFALWVNANVEKNKKLLFTMFSNRPTEEQIREEMYMDYKREKETKLEK